MTTNFGYGHSHVFWDFIFRSIEDSDELENNEKVITIISPWLRDISVGSSNIPAEDLGITWEATKDNYLNYRMFLQP